MKILLVSDKESSYIWDHFDLNRFKDIDLTISCGDLKSKYLQFLVTMIKAPLFYVHGNHDTHYKKNPPLGCDCLEDKIMVYKNIRFLGLGGSMRYKPGLFQYTEEEMKKRIRKLRSQIKKYKGFDVLVTHAPAYGLNDGTDRAHIGFRSFLYLINKYKPKYMFHGHQHLNYGRVKRIFRYNETTIINCCGYYIVDY